MEALIILCSLLVYPVAIATAVLSTKHYHRRKASRDLDTWATQLGMERVGDDLHGMLDGVAVGIRLAHDRPGDTEPRSTVYARLQPPLDLGLTVHPRHLAVKSGDGRGAQVAVGDPDFDGRFRVYADEAARANALLDPQVRAILMGALRGEGHLLLNDQGVALQTLGRFATLDWARHATSTCIALIAAINDARGRIGEAGALVEHKRAWVKFAQHHGLHGISAPLCMWGQIAGATVYTYSVRHAAAVYRLEVWLRFEEPLGLGLLLQPKRTVDRVKEMFGAEDQLLGDPLFDETFLLRGSDSAGVERLLDAELRRHLLAVHSTVGALSLTDDGLSVRLPHVPVDPAVVPGTVEHLLSLATHVASKRGAQRGHGPYR